MRLLFSNCVGDFCSLRRRVFYNSINSTAGQNYSRALQNMSGLKSNPLALLDHKTEADEAWIAKPVQF